MNLNTHCSNCFKPLTICSCNFNSTLIATTTDLLPPFTTLDRDRYRVGRVLGRGGFGVVYAGCYTTFENLGNDIELPLAIKEFFPAKTGLATRNANKLKVNPNPKRIGEFRYWQEQFLKEALTLLKLNHPSIVRLHTILHDENATTYLIMERLYGDTLAEYLGGLKTTADRLSFNKQLSIEEANTLFKAIAKALEALHERSVGSIIHLDLNPNNIFILDKTLTQIKLLDFGLAKDNTKPQNYTIGSVAGHPNFMAPEQAQQKNNPPIGTSADCYSVGACIYASITGQFPPPAIARLNGTPLADIAQQIPQLRNSALAETIMACLNLDPMRRPQNAMQLAICLEDSNEQHKYTSNPENLLKSNDDHTIILCQTPTNILEKNELQIHKSKHTDQTNQLTSSPINSFSTQKPQKHPTTLPTPDPIEITRPKKNANLLIKSWTFKIIFAIIFTSIIIIGSQLTWHKLFYTSPIRYQINNNGTVTDNLTGLLWKRCSEGQIWNGTTCTGQANNFTWKQIMPKGKQKKWKTFANYKDWHIPTIEELRTLVWCSNETAPEIAWKNLCNNENLNNDASYLQPTINPLSFPNTPTTWFWSATATLDFKNVQIVYFANGGIFWTNHTNSGKVRLVRAIVPH